MKELREMPYNRELEQEVLGCAFLTTESADKIVSILDETDFYITNHKRIFNAIVELRQDKMTVESHAMLQNMGNDYLDDILDMDNVLSDANLEQHVKLLKELSFKRKVRNIPADDIEKLSELFEKFNKYNIITSYDPVVAVGDILDSVFNYYENGSDKGVCTGWTEMDKHYTVSKGQFTIVTGIPFSGKSEWLDHLMVNLAEYEKWKFGVFSPENFPVNRHVKKIIEKHSGMPFFEGYHQRLSFEDLRTELDWINNHFYFLNPVIEDRNIDFLLRQIRTLVIEKKIDGFILDPWNEIEHARENNKTETDYISECLSKIRTFARNYNIHIWIVAHPAKLQKDKSGEYPVPTPYDISGSAHWRNKADNCITIHRPDIMKDRIQVHVQKVRFKDNGRLGMVEMKYDVISGKFEAVEDF